MKDPKDFTNDELALNFELWAALNDELSDNQKAYFEELVWRLRLLPDVEKENPLYDKTIDFTSECIINSAFSRICALGTHSCQATHWQRKGENENG